LRLGALNSLRHVVAVDCRHCFHSRGGIRTSHRRPAWRLSRTRHAKWRTASVSLKPGSWYPQGHSLRDMEVDSSAAVHFSLPCGAAARSRRCRATFRWWGRCISTWRVRRDCRVARSSRRAACLGQVRMRDDIEKCSLTTRSSACGSSYDNHLGL
jgi:hypothetical protein